MGNGVSSSVQLPADIANNSLAAYGYVDGLCRQGYFMQRGKEAEYAAAVKEAIKQSQLDILEVSISKIMCHV